MEKTIGEQRVRADFSLPADSTVEQIKQQTAILINICEGLKAKDPQLAAIAQNAFDGAAMWAIKAASTIYTIPTLEMQIEVAREAIAAEMEQAQCDTGGYDDPRFSVQAACATIRNWERQYKNRPNGKEYRIVVSIIEIRQALKCYIMLLVGNDVVKSDRKHLQRFDVDPRTEWHVKGLSGWIFNAERRSYTYRVSDPHSK